MATSNITAGLETSPKPQYLFSNAISEPNQSVVAAFDGETFGASCVLCPYPTATWTGLAEWTIDQSARSPSYRNSLWRSPALAPMISTASYISVVYSQPITYHGPDLDGRAGDCGRSSKAEHTCGALLPFTLESRARFQNSGRLRLRLLC
jgi:hypothetical protein